MTFGIIIRLQKDGMEIQISFDITDLEKALLTAKAVEKYADSLAIGSPLLYRYGVRAIEAFRETFPEKILLADAKIIEHGKQAAGLLTQAGARWVTVMAGANKNVIHAVCTTAHENGNFVMLDLLDACSLGQSALEAKSMGIDALLLSRPQAQDALKFIDTWDMVRGNSALPIYISGRITKDIADKIKALNPDGIVLDKAIVEAENPEEEAQFFKEMLT